MLVVASGSDSGSRHAASWWPMSWMKALRCNRRDWDIQISVLVRGGVETGWAEEQVGGLRSLGTPSGEPPFDPEQHEVEQHTDERDRDDRRVHHRALEVLLRV